jgi:hypothetical protein
LATSFPTSLDALTNPTSADTLASPDHAAQHANVNDAVEAIEAEIGTTASPVLARLASPTFTGTPTLPTGTIATTQTAADSSTKVATTAFVTTADNLKANLASPTFTGTPLSTTAAVDTNTTQIATTAYVVGQGYAKLASPTFTGTPTLPTGTIATTQTAADSSTKVATTAFVTTADNLKANLASPTFTGTPTLPTGTIATTQTAADSTTKVATTAFVTTADNLKANLVSPTFTGVPAAPTAAVATNTTQLATTAFVIANAGSSISKAQRASTTSIPGVALFGEAGAQTLASLVVYYNPVVVTSSITITEVSVHCDGAGAGASGARLSIYNASSAWVPTTLVSDCGTVVLTSTGTKTISSLSITLTPGNYFFRVQADSTGGTRPTLYTVRGNPLNWQFLNNAGTQYIYGLTATAASYVAAEATVSNLPANSGSSTSPHLYYMRAVWT